MGIQVTPLPEAQPRRRRVAVGVFDGVHLGHREVIAGSDTVLTFEPHPLAVIAPPAAPKLLTRPDTKAELIEDVGAREMVVIPFDADFAHQSAQAFIDHVLVERLGATHVAVGRNFRFGHRAAGDAAMLAADGRFETAVHDLVEVEGETVSSSHIRGLVSAGEVAHAAAFLGRPFQLRGEVVHGDGRGRELGYPTANLIPDEGYVRPDQGVYAALADGRPAAVNIGVRPQFETGRGILVEAYVIDYEGDLYGHDLHLDFLQRLRGEKLFPSVDALVEQIAQDVERAREACRRAA